jgi:hypothetical protein
LGGIAAAAAVGAVDVRGKLLRARRDIAGRLKQDSIRQSGSAKQLADFQTDKR